MATATKSVMEMAAKAIITALMEKATKRAGARVARGMGTVTKRVMARVAKAMAAAPTVAGD